MWCVFIWGLHGKHCVVRAICMYKSLNVVEGRGAEMWVSWRFMEGLLAGD